MKQTLAIFAVLLILFASIVSAQVSVNGVTLGDINQPRGQRVQSTFVVTNTGSANLSGLTASTILLSDSVATARENDFQLRLSSTVGGVQYANVSSILFNLTPTGTAGASQTFTITGFIPLDFDAVDTKTCDAQSFKIADVSITGPGLTFTSSSTTTINMQAENQLQMDHVDVCINDNCESVNDNDNVKNIRPGDAAEVHATIKNNFPNSRRSDEVGTTDIDFEDGDFCVEIDDRNLNVDECENIDNINADDKDDIQVSFDVDNDADDRTYNMDIRACAVDQNGAEHGEKFGVDFEVQRQTHEVLIERLQLTPTSLSCNQRSGNIRTSIRNTGKRDEKHAAVTVEQASLGVHDEKSDIDLNQDDSSASTFTFSIPANTKPGTYPITVSSFYDASSQSDQKTVDLIVAECQDGTQPATIGNGVTPTPVVQPPVYIQQPPVEQPVSEPPRQQVTTPPRSSTSTAASQSTLYIAGVIVLILVVLVLLIAMIRRLFRK